MAHDDDEKLRKAYALTAAIDSARTINEQLVAIAEFVKVGPVAMKWLCGAIQLLKTENAAYRRALQPATPPPPPVPIEQETFDDGPEEPTQHAPAAELGTKPIELVDIVESMEELTGEHVLNAITGLVAKRLRKKPTVPTGYAQHPKPKP